MLTKYQIESIRKRAESATEGPWRLYDEYCDTVETYSGKSVARVQSEGNRLSDMEFIANARQDIPALLDHIAELEAELKAACYAPLKADRKEQLRRFIGSSSIGSISLTDVLRDYKYEGSDENDNV